MSALEKYTFVLMALTFSQTSTLTCASSGLPYSIRNRNLLSCNFID